MQHATPDDTAPAVEPADAIDALMRVLDSDQLSRSPRASGFLAYVVTETLAGRGENLSERTIARRALKRGSDFDGREDASVRVQASRVRKSLEDYYAHEGANDPVRIRLPRGSYAVELERGGRTAGDMPRVPGVVVAMLSSSGDEPAALVARSLSESLVQQLASHSHVRVVGPVDPAGEAARSASAAGVTTILTGHVSVRVARLTLNVRLLDAGTSEVLWTDDASVDLAALAGAAVDEQWSREIAAKVGDPSGLVIRQELRRDRSASAEPELAARLAFYAYLDDGSIPSIHEAVEKLDAALDAGARTAPLLAMRAAMANTMSVYDFSDREIELSRAEGLAREALVSDGGNVHAHLVLSYPVLQQGHVDLAIELIETAASLAPYQPFYLSTSGMALIACGQWERGAALIREAFRLHPGLSGQTHGWLAFAYLAEGSYERALAEASLLPSAGDYLWGPLFRALALAGLGYDEQASTEARRAREIRPDVMDDVGAHLDSVFRLTEEERARLVGLLPAAVPGLPGQRDGTDVEMPSGSRA